MPARLPAPLGQTREAREHAAEIRGDCRVAADVGAEPQIVEHRHFGEQFALLRHEAEAALDALLDLEAGKIDAVERDAAAEAQQAHRAGQQRRLAGAVRADDGDDPPGSTASETLRTASALP